MANPRVFGKVLCGVFIIALILSLLVNCNQTATDISLTLTSTKTPFQQSFSLISAQNASNLSKIMQWQLYEVNEVVWAPDNTMVAIAGKDASDGDFGISTYQVNVAERFWFQKIYVPFSLDFHPHNQLIAVPFFAGFTLLESTTGRIVETVSYQQGVCFGDQMIKFSSDGKKILTLSTNPTIGNTTIYLWDFGEGECLGKFAEEDGVAFNFDLSDDGQLLVLGLRDIKAEHSYQQQIHLWNVQSHKIICQFSGGQPVTFTHDGKTIATTSVRTIGEVELWDAQSCKFLGSIMPESEHKIPADMSFSSDSKLLALGNDDTFQIWDVATRKLLFESTKMPNFVSVVSFSPDGKFLLTVTNRTDVDDDAIITLWGIHQ